MSSSGTRISCSMSSNNSQGLLASVLRKAGAKLAAWEGFIVARRGNTNIYRSTKAYKIATTVYTNYSMTSSLKILQIQYSYIKKYLEIPVMSIDISYMRFINC